MDIKKELQRLKEYRAQLAELAKPGFGQFESITSAVLQEDAKDNILAVAEDPSLLTDASESYRVLCFDYYISIPLQEVLQCRNRFNNPEHTDELKEMEQQLRVLVDNEELSKEDISLLPDLFHSMLDVPSDTEPQDNRLLESLQKGLLEAFKILESPEQEVDFLKFFKMIATVGQDNAVVCLINKQAGVYRDFEWAIIEKILRSPVFPDFFTECENKAGTPEIPYEYRNWPKREYFLNLGERGKGVDKYIAYLHPKILDSFNTDEGYDTFKKFMQQLALYGKIDNDANMEALLQLITGYHFEGAAKSLQWPGSDEEVRVLFYIIKYTSIASKGKYTVLQKGSNINYVGIDPESDVYKNLVDTYSDKKDPGRFLQGARGISDSVLISLHSIYSFFPETRDKA